MKASRKDPATKVANTSVAASRPAYSALQASGDLPVLTSAYVVCRESLLRRGVGVLPHIVRQIDGFLDSFSGPDAVMSACKRGASEHLLTLLASRGSVSYWKNAALCAAENGRVHVLQWLSQWHPARCDWGVDVMDGAARYGHLEALRWVHENRSEGCTSQAMDWAICRGDVEMARWLHTNRTEGCTDYAMNYAAFRGHLTVLQWMTENRREGRPGLALRAAAQNNHLHVVQWLYKQCDDRYRGLALQDAEKYKHWDLVAWLEAERAKRSNVQKMVTEWLRWLSNWLVAASSASSTQTATAKTCMEKRHCNFYSKQLDTSGETLS
ncbi:hypothetical protein BBJ28_00000944 [Nothophytophthora sp. Chile5]|nr:hypothetical protein BBJ28_00000944 [Nothophytophthora sp. Chile5]